MPSTKPPGRPRLITSLPDSARTERDRHRPLAPDQAADALAAIGAVQDLMQAGTLGGLCIVATDSTGQLRVMIAGNGEGGAGDLYFALACASDEVLGRHLERIHAVTDPPTAG